MSEKVRWTPEAIAKTKEIAESVSPYFPAVGLNKKQEEHAEAALRAVPHLCEALEEERAENARLAALVETLEADRDAVIGEWDRMRAALEQISEWPSKPFGDRLPNWQRTSYRKMKVLAREALGRDASVEGETT